MLAPLLAMTLGACTPAQPAATPPSPSPSPSPSPPAIPDFNGRVGSNRVAAEASLRAGRALYADGEYWEVFVRTTPPQLTGTYDPGDPASATPIAAQATDIDVVMATESGAAIRLFGAGGVVHEKAEINRVVKVLTAAFPNVKNISFRVFYGEAFQHATAHYHAGVLDYTVAATR